MKNASLLLAASALLAAIATPPAAAAAAGCASFSFDNPVPVGLAVAGPFPNTLGAACFGGLSFTSITAACPLNIASAVALAGEYCGTVPGFAPFTTITCTGVAAVAGTTFKALVIGLDFAPWNGNVVGGEPLAYEGVYGAIMHTTSIANPGPLPGRVIAYPVGVVGPGPIIVECAGVASVPVNAQFPPGACGNFKLNRPYADCGKTLPHGGPECSGVYDEVSSGAFLGGSITPYVQICDTPGGGESICIGAIREPPGTWDETCLDPLGHCPVHQEGGTVGYGNEGVRRTDALGGESWGPERNFDQTYYDCPVERDGS